MVILFLLLSAINVGACSALNISEYGLFEVVITNVVPCWGPKTVSCCDFNVDSSPDGKFIDATMNVTRDIKPDMGKMTCFTLEPHKQPSPLLRFQMSNPCKHIFLRPLLTTMLNATKDCIVMKGYYSLHINSAQMVQDYFAGKFLYGNFSFRVVLYNRACNFICSTTYISIIPKYRNKLGGT